MDEYNNALYEQELFSKIYRALADMNEDEAWVFSDVYNKTLKVSDDYKKRFPHLITDDNKTRPRHVNPEWLFNARTSIEYDGFHFEDINAYEFVQWSIKAALSPREVAKHVAVLDELKKISRVNPSMI